MVDVGQSCYRDDMIFAALILASSGCPHVVAGSFCHGQWQGECFRDGTLRGMNDEICRARWSGNLNVYLERDADKLVVFVFPRNENDVRCSESAEMSSRALADPARAEALFRIVRALTRRIAKKCLVPSHLSSLNLRDLRATLRETDGLIHILG